MDPSDRLIVPLDVSSLDQALTWLDRLPSVRYWKVGLELFVSSGPEILRILRERDKGIFLDLKFHDIPNTVVGACTAAAQYGVTWLTLHVSGGREAIERSQAALQKTAEALNLPCPTLLGVTLLTSLNARHLAFDLKVALDLLDYVQQLALLAQESGAGGVVCSPQEIEAVRQVCDRPFQIICPGIRPTWAERGDQQRTLTPRAAIAAGADYLVIGRPITQAPDPEAALHRLWEELT
ncbi:MAG: orotidine-5'-phosphate decarboxylase [Prochlorotrichaceae cyanobacterium]|jgi:orotidine-5'-phosphate decarboxylase